jgi:hypothetical protein
VDAAAFISLSFPKAPMDAIAPAAVLMKLRLDRINIFFSSRSFLV